MDLSDFTQWGYRYPAIGKWREISCILVKENFFYAYPTLYEIYPIFTVSWGDNTLLVKILMQA